MSSDIQLDTPISNGLPDSIYENEIFPYLNSSDLFYSVRGVSTEWGNIMKGIWSSKLKDDLIGQVKALDFVYEKEVYSKTLEFKLNYLVNYRNLLSAYNGTANIFLIIKSVVPDNEDPEIFQLLVQFFDFVRLTPPRQALVSGQLEELNSYLENEANFEVFKVKMNEMLDMTEHFREMESLTEFKEEFGELDKEYIEGISENAKLIHSFLQGLLEFQVLKLEVKELEEKIQLLKERIHEQTLSWPKKKNFIEKAYKLIVFTKTTSDDIKNIVAVYEDQKIRHPLVDFNDGALKLIYELRNKFDSNKTEIEDIDETIFENILSRRILLTKKLMMLERFSQLYNQCKTEASDNSFSVNGNSLTLKQFLWCMKISSNLEQENVTKESMLVTKEYLDKNFDYERHIIQRPNVTTSEEEERLTQQQQENEENIGESAKDTEIDTQFSETSMAQEHADSCEEVTRLRIEKEKLEAQKERTEGLLAMLKRFIDLKENMVSNKKRYKLILYVLSKLRKGEINSCDEETMNEVLNTIDIDQIHLSQEDTLSEHERTELENFDSTEGLLDEIEANVLKQVSDIFEDK